jgi:hypothetical protein
MMNEGKTISHSFSLSIKNIMNREMLNEILRGLKPQLKMGKLTKQLLGELNDEKKHRFNQLRKSLIKLT